MLRRKVQEEQGRQAGRASDADLLFGELSRPLDAILVRDGLGELSSRMASATFRRSMNFGY